MKAIVLAAGECSRFWPLAQDRHKAFYEVGSGQSVLGHTLSGLAGVGIREVLVVVNLRDKARLSEIGNSLESLGLTISSVVQSQSLGMGDGILRAKEWLTPEENFLVLNASQIHAHRVIVQERRALKLLNDRVVLFGQRTAFPWNFGIMELDNGRVIKLAEKPAIPMGDIRVLGIYALPYWFLEDLAKFQGGYSLEGALASVINKNDGLHGIILPDQMSFPSLKFPWDLLALNECLMTGKSFKDLAVDGEAEVHPSALLYGPVVIGPKVKIMEGAVIKGPCFIGEGSIIGTHSLVRGCTYLGRRVTVGAHSEVKNSLLYEGASLHRNFVGDSILDQRSHLGAGTITANKKFDRKSIKSIVCHKVVDTGRTALGAVLSAGVETGVNVSILPGVKIGSGVRVFPGAVVAADVADQQFFGRPVTNPKKKGEKDDS